MALDAAGFVGLALAARDAVVSILDADAASLVISVLMPGFLVTTDAFQHQLLASVLIGVVTVFTPR